MSVLDSLGREVVLEAVLGRGGEGVVHSIAGRKDVVAKVYLSQPDPAHAAKIEAMVGARTERLLKLTAWPLDILRPSPGGPVVGLLMPSVAGLKQIHNLYNPKARLAEFPDAGWPFLLRSAANLARAFSVVHEHGHVVGDVNNQNIYISSRATAMLIDCDSFQVTLGGKTYTCDVGVPEYQPPELAIQKTFRGIVRTSDHDCFGLAVLIFQLLMLGRHPFSGRYLAKGDMTTEVAIRERRFAYGPSASTRQMAPPPYVPFLDVLSMPVATLFEQAFTSTNASRPSAARWVDALTVLENQISACPTNPGHSYFARLSTCPWCEFEARTGKVMFVVTALPAVATSISSPFNLEAIWSEILSVSPPAARPPLPTQQWLSVKPNPVYASARRSRRIRKRIGYGALAAGIVLWLSLTAAIGCTSLVFAVAGGVVALSVWPRNNEVADEAKRKLEVARAEWHDVAKRYENEGSDAPFKQKQRELEGIYLQLKDLPSERTRRMQQLEAGVRARQLQAFLDQHRLADAKVKGIGDGRLTTLISYGVETAADVEYYAVISIPGFGPLLTQSLVDWRTSVERRFRYDPNRGVDPRDRQTVEAELRMVRQRLENALQSGKSQLEMANQMVVVRRATLKPLVDRALSELAQAEADCSAC